MINKTVMKRDIFAELAEGFDALAKQREAKLTLSSFKLQSKPVPHHSPQDVFSGQDNSSPTLAPRVFQKNFQSNHHTLSACNHAGGRV